MYCRNGDRSSMFGWRKINGIHSFHYCWLGCELKPEGPTGAGRNRRCTLRVSGRSRHGKSGGVGGWETATGQRRKETVPWVVRAWLSNVCDPSRLAGNEMGCCWGWGEEGEMHKTIGCGREWLQSPKPCLVWKPGNGVLILQQEGERFGCKSTQASRKWTSSRKKGGCQRETVGEEVVPVCCLEGCWVFLSHSLPFLLPSGAFGQARKGRFCQQSKMMTFGSSWGKEEFKQQEQQTLHKEHHWP